MKRFLPSLIFTLLPLCSNGAILISRGGPWNYFKGTAEASNPSDAWRAVGFNDASWTNGNAPFRYGDGSGGTVLSDMRFNYTTVFLRRTFNVSDVALISQLDLVVDYDDGFAVWINGSLVRAENPPITITSSATAGGSHESGSFQTFPLANPQSFLIDGQNTIAIQVFNISLTSSDVMMNPELVSTAPDSEPPVVSNFVPPPGNLLNLSQITVTFSEPVTGVDASDMTVNDVEAQSVSGSGDQYTFTFAAVPFGTATVEWSQDHNITDTAVPPNPFESTLPSEVRTYTIVDDLAPSVTGIFPPPNLTLREILEISVSFSEAVTGLDAADLLANGAPAASLTGSGTGPYLFAFNAIANGAVAMTWANSHGITDLAADPNAFAGTGWSYTVDPNASFGDLAINEFVASNRSGLLDQDGEASDWIELHNFGATALTLTGWALSDDADEPGKFILPDRTLPSGGYLVIFASGKDRAPAGAGEIHTSFKLAASGEYLGLFTPELPRVVADEISPVFPVQRNDHSYGRDSLGTWRYYATPTPGSPNGNSSIFGLLPTPHVNVARGFYSQAFDLHLTSEDPRATIRYTTNGSEPTSTNGRVYSSPIRVTSTRVIRAAAFRTGYLPSEIITHTYFYNVSNVIRSLPVISLVTDNSNLWGSTGIQETNPRNTTKRGIAWERPVSAELIKPGDNSGFQVNCGLRVQGGDYVRGRYNPNGSLPFSKYSFRLYFRGDYGPTMLHYPFFEGSEVEVFDRITLRAGMNDHSNPFIVDELVRRMQIDSKNVGARGNFVNLFINGSYKGYYNPTERIDDDFMRSWHGGGNDWDVIAQFGEVREGNSSEWNSMRTIVGRDMTIPANYQAALDVLDLDNFIDYLITNVYGGTGDWPHNNWRAARERVAGAKFRFYAWDAEWSFGNLGRSVNGNTLTGELGGGSEIALLYQSLVQSSEFRLRWADRVHRHFFNGGAYEDSNISDHYESMRSELSAVLPGMSTSIRNTWIPQRRGVIMQDMAGADLERSGDAPSFNQLGGSVQPGFQLTMSSPGGTMYYTVDGTDPRAPLDANNGGFTRTVLAENAAKRVWVPTSGVFGQSWTGGNEPFSDNSWTAGTGAVDYDEQAGYRALIAIDVEAQMNNRNTSCYIRMPFTVTAADMIDVNFMQLRARYDDGFVAYLNGVRILGPNAPAAPIWSSPSNGNNPDASAVNLRGFNVSDFLGELVIGSNILAIHGLNDGIGSSDFLNSVLLEVGENQTGNISATAITYTTPATINGTTLIKARTLRNGTWSALTEFEFLNGPDAPALRITEIMYNPVGGSAFEFLELQNVDTRTIDLAHMNFDGITFSFREGTTLTPGQRLVLSSNNDPTAFASRYPGVTVFGTYTGNLSNGGERLALLDGLGRTIISVDYDDTNGWPTDPDGNGHSLVLNSPEGDPDSPASWSASAQADGSPGAAEPATPQPEVTFSEVLADNRSAVPNGGTFPAMIELHNPGAGPVNLSGWTLINDGENPQTFVFPGGTGIDIGNHLVIWCDSAQGVPGLHAGFALDPEGGSLSLEDTGGIRVDTFSFGMQVSDHSLSMVGPAWRLTVPTPGSASVAAVALAPQSQLSINEWISNRVPGESDWLELYNRDTSRPVALRDLHLKSGETTYRYGALSFLAPHDFVRLWADEGVGAKHLDFRLPAAGGTLSLTDAGGSEFELTTYPPQVEDVSSGRFPDGSATIRTFPDAASPEAANYLSSNPGLVFNELLAEFGGAGPGWVEIKNTSGSGFNLTGHSLAVGDRDGLRWPFPNGLTIPVNGHLVITCDGLRPASSTPADLNSGIALSPLGEELYLFDDAGHEIDHLVFGFQVSGLSIGRISDIGSWTLLSSPTEGTPNTTSAILGLVTAVRINEWLANPASNGDDFIELFNTSATQPILLSGLRLTEDLSLSGIDQYAIPALSFIGARGFVAFTADGSSGWAHLPFNLDANGETLRLYRTTGTSIIDEVTWGIETEGASSGRTADGGAIIAQLAFQSPGASNVIDPNADSDGDGMIDSWETENGLNPNDAIDAALDGDGDQRSNLYEFISGTNPNDPGSVLEITSMSFDQSGFTLEFTARAGIRYTVELSDDLVAWQTLTVLEPAAVDYLATVLDAGARLRRFYRITAERP
ncbi:MAG: lamin tail domain-containing protein [Roseibacillus sp.]